MLRRIAGGQGRRRARVGSPPGPLGEGAPIGSGDVGGGTGTCVGDLPHAGSLGCGLARSHRFLGRGETEEQQQREQGALCRGARREHGAAREPPRRSRTLSAPAAPLVGAGSGATTASGGLRNGGGPVSPGARLLGSGKGAHMDTSRAWRPAGFPASSGTRTRTRPSGRSPRTATRRHPRPGPGLVAPRTPGGCPAVCPARPRGGERAGDRRPGSRPACARTAPRTTGPS